MSTKRALRTRKVSQRMAVVDDSEREQAVVTRLDALENDAAGQDAFAVGSDDEEFVLRDDSGCEDEDASSGRRKKKKARVEGGMRKTRTMIADRSRGPKGFKDYLEEAELVRLPEEQPSYLTAQVGPPRTRAPRKFCSVCGDTSNYTCTRCGAHYCCIRCYGVHTDTRCLKFIA